MIYLSLSSHLVLPGVLVADLPVHFIQNQWVTGLLGCWVAGSLVTLNVHEVLIIKPDGVTKVSLSQRTVAGFEMEMMGVERQRWRGGGIERWGVGERGISGHQIGQNMNTVGPRE